MVINSIQTMWTETADATPGTVTQVRGAAQALIRFAKLSGACVILVGHVTKDGQIAGPRVVEHMVDAVASFEGDGSHHFRILRNVKNRFGPTDEIGVFEMTGAGLSEVANPSALFLAGRDGSAPGAAVFAGMEGTRPVLVEIQALVAPSALGTPRRAVVGWDPSRLAMLVAVLEAHGRVKLGQHDIYLNVAGGMKITEPAADLAAAAALVSSLTGAVLPHDMVFFGEVGLSGAVRPVPHANLRLKEAAKLGFSRAVAPQGLQETEPRKRQRRSGGHGDAVDPPYRRSHRRYRRAGPRRRRHPRRRARRRSDRLSRRGRTAFAISGRGREAELCFSSVFRDFDGSFRGAECRPILTLVLLAVVLISALLAMLRGFTREVMAILSWGMAAAAAVYFYPLLLPKLSDPTSPIFIAKDALAPLCRRRGRFFRRADPRFA